MRTTFFILVFIICSLFTFKLRAQDRMFFKNGDMVEAKILEVSSSEIVYKKATNPDGPSYHELKSNVSKIEFANGTVEVFSSPKTETIKISRAVPSESNPAAASETPKAKEPTFVAKKNSFSYNLTDAFFKRITIGYERIIANGFLGVKIPVSFGLGSNKVFDVDYLNSFQDNNNDQYYNYNAVPNEEVKYTSILRKNTFGLELNVYPFGQRPVSFFVGPSFYYGLIKIKYEETTYKLVTNSSSYYNYYDTFINYKEASTISLSGMINTGFAFNTNSNFSMIVQIGLGFRQNNTDFDDYTATLLVPSYHLAYKF
ncbi:MAG: hypothetical protein IPP32_15920 [Bacteroidetes bacterium]|nr:hypothetical protein [Bacteroidota bacterium]